MYQTSNMEAFHSVLNKFAPNVFHFHFELMYTRWARVIELLCAMISAADVTKENNTVKSFLEVFEIALFLSIDCKTWNIAAQLPYLTSQLRPYQRTHEIIQLSFVGVGLKGCREKGEETITEPRRSTQQCNEPERYTKTIHSGRDYIDYRQYINVYNMY